MMIKFALTFVFCVVCSGCSKSSETQLANATITKEASDRQKAAIINVELGLGYLSQGQVARAKSKLTYALKLAPKIPEPHSAMAYFLERVSDNKEAEVQHKAAVQLASSKGAVYNNYGAFLCRQNRFIEADNSFQLALQDKTYPRTAEVYENAGLCALKSANQAKAAEYFATSVKRDPNRSSALLELAALDLVQGKAFEAKKLLTQHRSFSEPNARSLWLGIQASKALNEQESARKDVEVLKNLFEDSPEYQAYLKTKKGAS